MQHITSEDQHDQTTMPPQMDVTSGPQHLSNVPEDPAAPENKQPLFYTQEDDFDLPLPAVDDQEDPAGQSSPFVLPFQHSAPMPTMTPIDAAPAQGMTGPFPRASMPTQTRRVSAQVVKVLLIVSVVLVTIIGTGFFVLAQSTTSSHPTQNTGGLTNGATTGIAPITTHPIQGTQANTTLPTPRPTTKTSVPPTPTLSSPQDPGTQGTVPASALPTTQMLTQLGWTQAGLTLGNAFEALRTSATFTDREMSYDYRAIGTPANHSGTLTGSTFLLTPPGGKVRFAQNDKRVINNTLYNQIATGKVIQQVLNAVPTLVQFQVIQVQGQARNVAWVTVAFELFQSKIDPASGKRIEHLELDPATGQPVLHHLAVVLVRVSPQNQGASAPMGGTGWLIDTYALDANTLPALATTPSL